MKNSFTSAIATATLVLTWCNDPTLLQESGSYKLSQSLKQAVSSGSAEIICQKYDWRTRLPKAIILHEKNVYALRFPRDNTEVAWAIILPDETSIVQNATSLSIAKKTIRKYQCELDF